MITTTKQEYSSLIAYRTTLPWLIGITTQIKPAGLYRDWVWSPDPAACLRVRLVTAVRDSSRKMALYSPPLPATSRIMQSGVVVVVVLELRAEQLTASLLELPVYATTGNPTLSAFFWKFIWCHFFLMHDPKWKWAIFSSFWRKIEILNTFRGENQ